MLVVGRGNVRALVHVLALGRKLSATSQNFIEGSILNPRTGSSSVLVANINTLE